MKYNAAIERIAMPPRIAKLPIDERGFPVPRFVAWPNGKPDFRVADSGYLAKCLRRKLCWVCGEPLGRFIAFCLGPMCAINRVTAEPHCHRDCAIFSAKACPFLSQPRMRRNEKELPEHRESPGFPIRRNPGVACVWMTESFKLFMPPHGGRRVMFSVGDPTEVLWFANGREATRAEVDESIASGLPLLQQIAVEEGAEAVAALERMHRAAMPLLPA